MAHIRKHYGKWQAVVRRNKLRAQRSFNKKIDASKWALKTEAQIETGSYLKIKKAGIQNTGRYLVDDNPKEKLK